MIRPIATLADGRPAYMQIRTRLRQSEIDRQRAWSISEVRRYKEQMK